jgi:hypothetical protein
LERRHQFIVVRRGTLIAFDDPAAPALDDVTLIADFGYSGATPISSVRSTEETADRP